MFRIDDATAASSLPTPETAGTEGYFTEGNPTAGTPATNVRGSWLNMIQEELCAILAAAGITRSKTTYNQVNTALRGMYSSVVGSARNVSMAVATASASGTLTADEIIVETALGGQTYRLASFNKTINLGTIGAGGMDTGTAPASGFVALYAIYNPTTGASALLAMNATSAAAPNVYAGANMPAGYTASALVSVWGTNSSRLLLPGYQNDRVVSTNGATVLTTTTASSGYTAFSVAGAVPPNGKTCRGYQAISGNTASAGLSSGVAGSSSGLGSAGQGGTMPTNVSSVTTSFPHIPLATSQTLFYTATASTGSMTYVVGIYEYTF